jgi:hypothetical protein
MPVPVAVTHAKGVGNVGAVMEELQTAGPFARQQKRSAEVQTASGSQQAAQAEANSAAVNTTGAIAANNQPPQASTVAGDQGQSTASAPALETHSLTFRYPGIGTYLNLW